MEDFGYSRGERQNQISGLLKKSFLLGATLFSIACFIYITISAYSFVNQKEGDIELVKSPDFPIKVTEEESEEKRSLQIDRSFYEDIFGNKKESLKKPSIRNVPEPALPPKMIKADKSFISESTPTIIESSAKSSKTNDTKGGKIIVYSDKNSEKPSQDFLTKKPTDKKEEPNVKTVSNKRKTVRVQIAAMTSRSSAEEYRDRIERLHPKLFSDLNFIIEEVDLGKRGIFYRLQIDNFFNQIDADEFCNRYVIQTQKSRSDCIVVE